MGAPKLGHAIRSVVICGALALGTTHCLGDFVSKPDEKAPPNAVGVTFVSQPAEVAAGAPLGDVAVALIDSVGDTVKASNVAITVALTGGKPNAQLRGTTTAATTDGIATFTDLSVDSAGAGYSLTASVDGLTPATSNGFAIDVGPAARLMYVNQPTNVQAMRLFSPEVRIAVTDALGNTVMGATGIRVVLNAPRGDALLLGDNTKNTSGGVATFNDLRVTRTGSGYSLTASADGLANLNSAPFDVLEPSDVIALVVQTQPGSTAAGTPFTVRIGAVNALGNVVPSAATTVTLSVVPLSGTPGAALSGTTAVATVGGVATFTDLKIDSAGAGYRLLATAPALTADTTAAFAILAGATARLAFIAQPGTAQAGAAITPGPQVAILDAQGNIVPTATNAVAVYITAGTGTPGATLTGAVSVAASGGIATFSNIAVSLGGNGYTLTAAAPGLASDVSAAFNIAEPPPPPAVTTIVVSPPNPVLTSFGASVHFTAQALDQNGNPMPGVTFAWASSNPAVATVDGTGSATAVADGSTTITATSGTVSGSTSLTVQQTVAVVTLTPDNVTLPVGDSIQVSATAGDARGNPMARPVTFTWASTNPQKVSVTADAVDSSKAWVRMIDTSGAAPHVTATAEGRTGSMTVH